MSYKELVNRELQELNKEVQKDESATLHFEIAKKERIKLVVRCKDNKSYTAYSIEFGTGYLLRTVFDANDKPIRRNWLVATGEWIGD